MLLSPFPRKKFFTYVELMIPNASNSILTLKKSMYSWSNIKQQPLVDNSIISCTQVSKQNDRCAKQTWNFTKFHILSTNL